MSRLLDTVRETIAECSEVAYDSLSLASARELMMFDKNEDLLDFMQSNHQSWQVANDRIVFHSDKQKKSSEIPYVIFALSLKLGPSNSSLTPSHTPPSSSASSKPITFTQPPAAWQAPLAVAPTH